MNRLKFYLETMHKPVLTANAHINVVKAQAATLRRKVKKVVVKSE